ncbi:MAG: lysine decarboxylase transcriptional regulator, CadC [Acidobacteriaceae bacterium]|jgi:cholera toxin transcriptional activator|nr:lysine decarboxylase transcriptional regulator, CadC [Acidobacteriaceae bacterium]
MATPSASSKGRVLRFGVFEADLAAGELRKNGSRVRLQEQPFQLLALLMEKPEGIVTREELRNELWAADTFVDFDHSLNTAIKKIREALGDSAVNPRYVETIARRGYRFLAPVEIQSQAGAGPTIPTTCDPTAMHSELEVPIPRRELTRALFVLIQIMYLAFYLSALFHWQSIEGAVDPFLRGAASQAVFVLVLITAGLGIPLRFYLLSAAAFDYRRLGEKFLRIFLLIFALDQLWALSPFLTTQKIGFGAAFAATAALLYVPFAEKTLLRMAYPKLNTAH